MNNAIAESINTDPFLMFFGTLYLVIGLSIFLAAKHWHDFIKLFVEHESLSLIMGILSLPISLFIICFYNNWDSLPSTVLMVMGFVGLVKALILLLRPHWVQGLLAKGYVDRYLWLDGLSAIILGAALLLL